MPPIVPNRFLVRVCHPCPFVKDAPRDTDDATLAGFSAPLGLGCSPFARHY